MDIYMGHTTETTLTTWMPVSEMIPVYSGLLSTTEEDSWIEIDLMIPFSYNNSDNLVIALLEKTPTSHASGVFYATPTDEDMSIYKGYYKPIDPNDPPKVYASSRRKSRPNVRLQMEDLATQPAVALTPQSGYYGLVNTGKTTDPHGEMYKLFNGGGGTLTITNVTDLSGTDFTTTFDEAEVSLAYGESYCFGFTYAPTAGEHDSLYFEIETNGGTVGISLTGDAYQLPAGMAEIGNDKYTNSWLPYNSMTTYTYTQSLFLQSEIDIADQQIHTLYYYFNGAEAFSDSVAIYMAHTAQDTLNDWIPYEDLALVYNGSLSTTAEEGWVELNLHVPFSYNNVDNLVIALESYVNPTHTKSRFYATETDHNMSVRCEGWENEIDLANPPAVTNKYGGASAITYRPDVRLQLGDIYTAPVALLSQDSGYYGYIEAGVPSDPFEHKFQLINSGPGTLTVNDVTDLTDTDFSTTFDKTEVSLETGGFYSFEFTYTLLAAEHDELYFEIVTNGGTVGVSLTGDAYKIMGEEVAIGEGEAVLGKCLPYYPGQIYSYTQSLYLQSEIDKSLQQIKSIYYHFNGTEAFSDSVVIYMGHTAQDTLNDWLPYSELTEVYNGTITTHGNDCWVGIVLDTPFVYNNVDNLVIAFDENSSDKHSNYPYPLFYSHATDINMSVVETSYEDDVDPTDLPEVDNFGGASNSVYRPDIRLGFEPAPQPVRNLYVDELGNAMWEAPITEQRGFLNYNIYLDGELKGATVDANWQYEGLVDGTTYLAGVSTLLDEGESDVVEYEFTYALNTPLNVAVDAVFGTLTWEAPAAVGGELLELSQHDNAAANADFQSYEWGYGVVYDLNGYSHATVEMVDFRHSPWGNNGTWDYKIHVVDWDTHTELAVIEGLQTTGDNQWEEGIELGSIPESGLVGIFMEPCGNVADDAYPVIDFDASLDGYSICGALSDYAGMTTAGGDFLMDLWIKAETSRGVVKARRIAVNANNQARIRKATTPVKADFITLNQTENSRDFTATYNVYLDDELVGEGIADLEYQFEGLVNGETYKAGVSANYDEGASVVIEVEFEYSGVSSDNPIVAKTALNGNYPNPFNPETTISYSIKQDAKVTIDIYNIKGQKVKTLMNEDVVAGHHSVVWKGEDNNGRNVASGVYFYRMKAGRYTSTKKMILMK